MTQVEVVALGIVPGVASEGAIYSPSQAPQPSAPESTQQRRNRRRPRAEFIRDVRRLITASWLAKTSRQWRWTPYDRECLYQLTMQRPAWEVMALWSCYIDRPWQECKIPHFCQPAVLDLVADDPRRVTLMKTYRGWLEGKQKSAVEMTQANIPRRP